MANIKHFLTYYTKMLKKIYFFSYLVKRLFFKVFLKLCIFYASFLPRFFAAYIEKVFLYILFMVLLLVGWCCSILEAENLQ